ncbi:ABC transporter ATP-binding protein [Nocardiopsis coralliicola]
MRQESEIRIEGLVKRYGEVEAVRGLGLSAGPGSVTGLLGPNGSGKTTTLRCLLGLARPTAGRAEIGGVPYARIPRPTSVVGAVLEGRAAHPAWTGRRHLDVYRRLAGVPAGRVGEVLAEVGLDAAADRRIRGYSTGMRRRLDLATALLGDPGVLILDEPGNGLDPAGAAWLRRLLRARADAGATVLVSSHLLAEVARTVDRVAIVHRGAVAAEGALDEVAPEGTDLEAVYLELTGASEAEMAA